jgi:hypothetical protein
MALMVRLCGMGNVRPLLLADVDGPLHPFAASAPPPGFVEYRWRRSWRRRTVRRGMAQSHARCRAPGPGAVHWRRVGVGQLLGARGQHHRRPGAGPARAAVVGVRAYGGHPDWKFGAVGRYAYGRPLAWLDDDFDLFPRARQAFLTRRTMTTALSPVDPATDITTDHLAAVEAALQAHPA